MSISELLQMLKTDVNSMSIGEKLLGGFCTALLAMVVVFIILVLIMYIIKAVNFVPEDKNVDTVSNSSNIANVQENQIINESNDAELVSIITAAIMASGSKNIVVKRITRTNNVQSNWEKTANIEV